MSNWLIGFVTLIYLGVTAAEWNAGNRGMAICYFGYALANVGLILSSRLI
jgi:hypothetical protein